MFLGRGSTPFIRFSKRKYVPLCHSHTLRLGPSCPYAHERRQTSAAEQPGQAHARWGSGVWVRLQIHGSCGQSIQEPQGSSNEPGTERWRVSHLDWGSPITLSQLEMFYVSNLFLLGRASKAETITIPPAQTDTRSYTAGFVASWSTGPELEAWLSGLLPLTWTNS